MKISKVKSKDSYVLIDGQNASLTTPDYNFIFNVIGFPNDKLKIKLSDYFKIIPKISTSSTVVRIKDEVIISDNEDNSYSIEVSDHDLSIESFGDMKSKTNKSIINLDLDWDKVIKFYKNIKNLFPESKILKMSELVNSGWFDGLQITDKAIRATNNLIYVRDDTCVTTYSDKLNIGIPVIKAISEIGVPNKTVKIGSSIFLFYDDGVMCIKIKDVWPDTSLLDIRADNAQAKGMCEVSRDFTSSLSAMKGFISNDLIYINEDVFLNTILDKDNLTQINFKNRIPNIRKPVAFSYESLIKIKRFFRLVGYTDGSLLVRYDSITFMVSEL